jgi:ankyrin repeat protein
VNFPFGSSERSLFMKLIEFLIEEGADASGVDANGVILFIICIINGEPDLCRFLVDRGADLSAKRRDGMGIRRMMYI